MSRSTVPAHPRAPRIAPLRRLGFALAGALGSLLALVTAPATAASEGVGFVRIWPGYRTADSFTTVGELFGGGGERSSGRIVRRTQPGSREGFYFLTRLTLAAPLPGAEVQLELVLPASANVVTHRFPLDLPAGEPVLHLGVTGSDWPGAESRPVAWRLSVRRPAAGEVLIQRQSSLWTAP